jgi:hypothetical protein
MSYSVRRLHGAERTRRIKPTLKPAVYEADEWPKAPAPRCPL